MPASGVTANTAFCVALEWMARPPRRSKVASPKRIQRKRIKGWRLPEGAVVVSRPSVFGNPFRIDRLIVLATHSHPIEQEEWHIIMPDGCTFYTFYSKNEAISQSVNLFRMNAYHEANGKFRDAARLELRGKDLACWCPLDQPCHADVLLEIANPKEPPCQ
jgi:hypothetical protein